MQDRVIAFRIDREREVSVAVTESGKIYAKAGFITRQIEWSNDEARWQCLGSVFDDGVPGEAGQPEANDAGATSSPTESREVG